jgi:antitoxin component YwqK of YwqJK toxin-antitoxin module
MRIEPPKKTSRDPNISLQLITKYHPNGQKKYEGYYEEQEPVGDHTAWYENGNKESVTIELSESVDLSTYWYENGQMKYKGIRTHYFETGLWTYWYENGNKKSEGCFEGEDGSVGKWRYWHSNGQLACVGIFQGFRGDGLFIFWNEAGQKIHENEYRDNELLDVWKNLRVEGCTEELVEKYKQYIFNVD